MDLWITDTLGHQRVIPLYNQDSSWPVCWAPTTSYYGQFHCNNDWYAAIRDFSETTVTVDVVDINDHAPQFVFDVNASRYTAEIPENAVPRIILRFVATDEDSGNNGIIDFDPSNLNSELEYKGWWCVKGWRVKGLLRVGDVY